MYKRIPFQLIKPNIIPVNRYPSEGEFVDGVYVRPVASTFNISALVSPCISKDVIQFLPEALRKRKVIRIFTNDELNEHNSQQAAEADELNYASHNYRVFKLGDWINVSGFTGREAYAVQIDAKDLSMLSQEL